MILKSEKKTYLKNSKNLVQTNQLFNEEKENERKRKRGRKRNELKISQKPTHYKKK